MANVAESCGLVERVADTVRRWGLFREARCVLVGLSGGADSVALLAVLRELVRRGLADACGGSAWRVVAAHLNHGIRSAAEADAQFVRELCDSWQTECVVETVDVPEEARRTGESIESAARRVRYAFLAATAGRVEAQVVAVAHHADDNAETVLHRALRGTGLAGLAGIPIERPLGSVRLVRPLLHCRRAEIEQFLAARGLPWREDETNLHLDYRRNFIRHDLLPRIRERINPRAVEALLRLAEQSHTATAYLRDQAEHVLEDAVAAAARATAFSAAVLAAAHPAVRSEAIRLFFERAGLPARDLSAAVVARVCDLLSDPTITSVNLPRDWRMRRRGDVVRLQPPMRIRPTS